MKVRLRDQLDLWVSCATSRCARSFPCARPLFLPDAGRQDGVARSPLPGAEFPANRPPPLRSATRTLTIWYEMLWAAERTSVGVVTEGEERAHVPLVAL